MESDELVENIQQLGVIVTIVKVSNLDQKVMQPVYFQVRTSQEQGDRISYDHNPCRKTGMVDGDSLKFNESFHYNTMQLVDDNLTFILKLRDGREIGRHTVRNLKHWYRQRVTEKTVEIKMDDVTMGEVLIRVQFKDHRDIVSGILVPDLSLVPRYPFNPKYNAIDGYNPNAKSNRANCFSFFDGDRIPGFDQIDVFPSKFKLPKDLK